jgi:hypothetical protein
MGFRFCRATGSRHFNCFFNCNGRANPVIDQVCAFLCEDVFVLSDWKRPLYIQRQHKLQAFVACEKKRP